MINQNQYWDLIAKKLAGEISPEEDQELSRWLNKSSQNRQIFEDASILWKVTQQPSVPDFNPDQAWMRIEKKIEKPAEVIDFKNSHNNRFILTTLAAAAVVALITILSLMFFVPNLNDSGPVAEVNKEIPVYESSQAGDKVRMVLLPDSSVVYLNKGSKIRFEEAFAGDEREVYLEGEAFFEIQHNPEKPFIVHANKTEIKVVGTAFNVRAMPEEPEVIVAVDNGKVKFSSDDRENPEYVFLIKDEAAAFNRKSGRIQRLKTKGTEIDWMKTKEVERTVPKTVDMFTIESSKDPGFYLEEHFSWKYNLINETIVEGKVYNRSTTIKYENIQLKITGFNKDGEQIAEKTETLEYELYPEGYLPFRFHMKDWLRNTQEVRIEVTDANVFNVNN